ncbi:MAG: response regulator transcription factor [Deltaproteobacteria bacterium]|nr:response regulator transcription factor [Deltaproteobacteria bacterium]
MDEAILIVDDEPDLVAALDYSLRREGFVTRTAASGHAALEAVALEPRPVLVLLDWMLPDLPGTEVFRRLRNDPSTASIPVVMVTARGEEVDRIVGLELGAEDYIVKPFSIRELVLRVRAVLRRSRVAGPDTPSPPDRMVSGALVVHREAHRAWVDGSEIDLTAQEFRLLLVFLDHAGRALTREQILADAWEDGVSITERAVDTHIKRLRRKLGTSGARIEAIRGVGYRFSANVE